MTKAKDEVKTFLIDNPRSIASDLNIRHDMSLYRAILDTDDIIVPRMYLGVVPFRVMCASKSKDTSIPVLFDREHKPLVRDRALIFGCDSLGHMRSLTEFELDGLTNLCTLSALKVKDRNVLGYCITGMEWKGYCDFSPVG